MPDRTLRDNLRQAPPLVKLFWVLIVLLIAVFTIKLFGIGGIIVTVILIRYTYKTFTEPDYQSSGPGSPPKH